MIILLRKGRMEEHTKGERFVCSCTVAMPMKIRLLNGMAVKLRNVFFNIKNTYYKYVMNHYIENQTLHLFRVEGFLRSNTFFRR